MGVKIQLLCDSGIDVQTVDTEVAFKQATGSCAWNITSPAECSEQAQLMGFHDVTATDDGQTSVSFDPPWCYYEDGSLKFNAGSNTGICTLGDICLCKGTPTSSLAIAPRLSRSHDPTVASSHDISRVPSTTCACVP